MVSFQKLHSACRYCCFSVFNFDHCFSSSYRLSEEMVACIAVEGISILEQLHLRGYFETAMLFICFFFISFTLLLHFFYNLLVSTSVLYMEMLSQRTFCLAGPEHLMRRNCFWLILVQVWLLSRSYFNSTQYVAYGDTSTILCH